MARALAREFAVVGLGRMGGNLARQAVAKGWRVVGQSLGGVPETLVDLGVVPVARLQSLHALLAPPRRVLLYIPAGPDVDAVLHELAQVLEPGDIVVDGGNSYWGDSIRRHQRLQQHGIALVDAGTSGGVAGAQHGACFMVGGDDAAVACVEPILRALAVDGGFVHAGPPGSGHFVKLVHNGIEFGMLQAIGEGLDLLSHYHAPLPIADILRNWRHGSVIRGWLMDLMEQQYRAHGFSVDPYIEDTGEVNWLVDDAMRMDVAVPVIAQAVMQLVASRDGEHNAARAVSLLRHGFGGHPFGRNATVARERQGGRVGGFPASGE